MFGDGGNIRTPPIGWIVVLALNLCVGAYLAVLIVLALGEVREGQTIRPMALFAHVMVVSIFAFGFSSLLGIIGPLRASRKLASYGLAFLTVLCGLIPLGVSMVVIGLIINMRSLVLAD